MMILKGNSGKSRVIDILMDKTDNICFVYGDYPLIFNSYQVDSREYSLDNFLTCISDVLKEESINDKHYHYLLIYTNQEEEYLSKIIDWLDKYRFRIPCVDIILTCK